MLQGLLKRRLPSPCATCDHLWSPRLLLRAISHAVPYLSEPAARKDLLCQAAATGLPRPSLPHHAVCAVGTARLHVSRVYSSSVASVSADISDEKWNEVVALLGEMAAIKNRPSGGSPRRNDFELMPIYLKCVGLSPERLASIHFIHVAGTKGKGSTCAMVESILRNCGYRTGLYTSPHLVDIRERIRVDGQMLPRAEFAAAFWRVYGALRATAGQEGDLGMPSFFYFITLMAVDAFLARPPHLVPHVVVLEVGIGGRLDATNAVVTPGSLVAAAITSLGFDHMEMLGDTLPKIAREKAGIMKVGRPVLVAPQPQDAMEALLDVAARVGAHLTTPPSLDCYRLTGIPSPPARLTATTAASASANASPLPLPSPPPPTSQRQVQPQAGPASSQPGTAGDAYDTASAAPAAAGGVGGQEAVLSLGGDHMRVNAALAVVLAAEWDEQYAAAAAAAAAGRPISLPSGGPDTATTAARAAAVRSLELPECYLAGLRSVRWPGRSQVVEDEEAAAQGARLTFYLDGAHTPESMAVCAAWFQRELGAAHAGGGSDGVAPADRHASVLLFNCMKERDPAVLLPALAEALTQALSQEQVQRRVEGAQGPGVPAAAAAATAATPLDAVIFTPMLSGGGVLLPPQCVTGTTAAGSAQGPPVSNASVDLTWQRRMYDTWRSRVAPTASSGEGPETACARAAEARSGLPASGSPGCGSEFPVSGSSVSESSVSESSESESGQAAGPATLAGLQPLSVAESLTQAIEAVRAAAVADPQVHVHVLVTGSLYLVGDVLRLLNKPPQ